MSHVNEAKFGTTSLCWIIQEIVSWTTTFHRWTLSNTVGYIFFGLIVLLVFEFKFDLHLNTLISKMVPAVL